MAMKKLTKKAVAFEKEVKKKMFTAIAAAFALVIALTWNEAINATVMKIINYFGIRGEGYLLQILAALLTTIICVIGIVYASRVSGKAK